MKKITKNIYQLTVPTPFAVGDVHMYLLKGDCLSLVDAGVKTKEALEATVYQLKQIGYDLHDIEQIFLTHHHPDHTGLVEVFPRLKEVIAHSYVDYWLTRDVAYFQQYQQFYEDYFTRWGVPKEEQTFLKREYSLLDYAGQGQLTKIITEGDVLPGHEEWKVIDTRGHAQSHLSFFREKDGLFIAGDHLLYHITPNPILEPLFPPKNIRPTPLLQYRANVEKCLSLDIKYVLPGHGPTFSTTKSLVLSQRSKQEKRAKMVYQLLDNQRFTPYQICQQLFPKKHKHQLTLTMSETMGQLDYLADINKVSSISIEDNLCYYHQLP